VAWLLCNRRGIMAVLQPRETHAVSTTVVSLMVHNNGTRLRGLYTGARFDALPNQSATVTAVFVSRNRHGSQQGGFAL